MEKDLLLHISELGPKVTAAALAELSALLHTRWKAMLVQTGENGA